VDLPLSACQDEIRCEIRPIPDKGLGVLATRNIAQGEEIITEAPFLVVDHPPNIQQLTSRLSALPPSLQNLFLTFNPSLATFHMNRLVNIAATNVIPLGDEPLIGPDDDVVPLDADGELEQRCRAGLFRTICRVNHSCAPNSRWTWFDSGFMSKYRACRIC
jgi:hypothetical protein